MSGLLRARAALGHCRTTYLSRRLVVRVLDATLTATLAPECAACGCVLDEPTRGPVCLACWDSIPRPLPPVCRICGGGLLSWRVHGDLDARCAGCQRGPSAVATGRSVGTYEGPLREIIRAFKYEGRRTLAQPLGVLLRDAAADVLRDADAVVPVPLHPWKRLRRGFNQASDLARTLDLPVVHALWRPRATATQTGLTASARQRNVRHAIRPSPLLSRAHLDRFVSDRVVVVVDDVRTTGATLEACARALRNAGAREVRTATVAVARVDR